MADESELILGAVSKGIPSPVRTSLKKKRLIEPGLCDPDKPDAILEYGKKMRKPPKPKMYLSQWTSTDFLRHLNDNLKSYGLELETRSVRDQDWMNKLYDLLVEHLEADMSNRVLREYLDWWIGTYTRLYLHKTIYVRTLMNEDHIKRFVDQWKIQYNLGVPIVEREEEEVDDVELFKLSGLGVLLMTRGIVVAYYIWRSNPLGIPAHVPRHSVDGVLKELSRDKLIEVMDRTMARTYNQKDYINFVDIAKEALKLHGIIDYDNVDSRAYFKERT